MEMRQVIEPHYVDFSEMVDPVLLASKLRSLTSYDRDEIQRQTNFLGRIYGVKKLYDVIIGKVDWLELCAALRKENFKGLLKILEEEYYQQHPTARPCLQDENLKSGVNHFEEEQTDSSTDGDISDQANSSSCMNFTAKASSSANICSSTKASCVTINVNFQIGNNNTIKTSPHLQNGDCKSDKDSEVEYQVCVECDNSKELEKNESQENMFNNTSGNTVQFSSVPSNPTVPQNVRPQFSSSSSDSQDGGSPKVCCRNEAVEHTAEKLIYQERNDDDAVCSAPSDNTSSHENTNAPSQSHGHVETGDGKLEKLGIVLRTESKRCKEGEEDENEEVEEYDEEETKLKEYEVETKLKQQVT